MNLYTYRGKRIRASDKNLIFNYALFCLFPVFLFVLCLFHCKRIVTADWSNLSVPYFICSLIVASAVCAALACLYRYFRVDSFKQLQHRQKLARMMLENKWYEADTQRSQGFFKDLNTGGGSKERITYFPKLFYRMKNGLLHVSVEITMGRYQEQLLRLEKKLESGLFCELVDKPIHEGYIEYALLYDTIGSRISIEYVYVRDGSMKLMETVSWAFDSLPHMLIAGGTGGGKTYFILTMIHALVKTNAKLYVLDPKNADLADLAAVMSDVYYKAEDMISCINNFYDDMMARNEDMKTMPGYKTGENYAYLGLPPHFLIFDEYVAFMEMIGRKESEEVLSKLKKIVMLGRQSGFFLVLACQRPDAKYLGDGIRDQFNFRVALGRMSELGYTMMFGQTQKDFFQKPIRGRGYVDVGTSVISEFYTPLVPKRYDFLGEIQRAIEENTHSGNKRVRPMSESIRGSE